MSPAPVPSLPKLLEIKMALTLLLGLAIFCVALTGMMIGVLLSGKSLKGSCGGIGALLGKDACLFCPKRPECSGKEKREAQ